MNTILLLFVTGLSVKACNEFKVRWNVPTEKCQKYGIYFNLSTYHIIQNSGDKFYGDKINIIYDPGRFPHFEGTIPMWGGIPQNGDVVAHTEIFESQVRKLIPSNFTGYIVLNFEAYQPNFDLSPKVYKNASRHWVKQRHPYWPVTVINYMARRTFNEAAEVFFKVLLEAGKILRPQAKWGYYHYPFCRNWIAGSTDCSPKQVKVNEEIHWLFKESGVLYPSIYIFNKGWNAYTSGERVKRTLVNALQIRDSVKTPVVSYFWFKFHDNHEKYLEPLDLWSTLGIAWYLHLDGAIIWGSSDDVKSEKNCLELKEYIKATLGPLVKLLSELSSSEA